jgi:Tol biopolymer transport system component
MFGLLVALVGLDGSTPVGVPAAASTRIAVSTTDGGILLINAGGRRVATLTRHRNRAAADWAPAWSLDGTRLAFARTTDGRRSFHIYVMRADGYSVRRITNGRFDESPSWSLDGRWIAYSSQRGIALVHPDGSGRRLVPGTGKQGPGYSVPFASDPSWTPGGRLVYSFHPENPSDWPASCKRQSNRCGWVMTSRIDGRDRRALVRGRDAHVSLDGARYVYTPPNGGVATIAAGGGKSQLLGRGYRASWSSDAQRIVYARLGATAGGDAIWVMDANGRRPHRILRGATTPAWAPV